MKLLKKITGDESYRFLKRAARLVDKINSIEPEFEKLSDEELRTKTEDFKKRLDETGIDEILPEAFATVREAAKRALGQRHYDVQLIGGVALHEGKVAEMKTGEGKTLVATLPLYLNALEGRGCHIVTPNDYLSRVGGGWMGPVYRALGISAGVITHDFSGVFDPDYQDPHDHGDDRLNHWRPVTRGEAYRADITYGTNNEFGFDYLRDNLVQNPEQVVQRSDQEGGRHYVIVDEVDSILIDEARTPLIISQPDEESGKLYQQFSRLVPRLEKEHDYEVDEKRRAVLLTQEGISKMEKLLGMKNLYEEGSIRFVHHLDQALKAHALFKRDRDYVVKEDEIIIVDSFTGRLMPGRRYSEGLHQAIEAKEGVTVQRESRTVATITFQNYFRMYEKLSGMTGTAATSSEEFFKVYGLEVIVIPTHRPMVRQDLPDRVYRSEAGKLRAVVREVKRIHQEGRPVLLGTVSIEKNEYLSSLLEKIGVPHKVLNAKNHEKEAEIIAQAGQEGAVTVATNMAGRGVDIVLGGNLADKKQAEKVRNLGGLHVIGTERHEARRIDNQLRGRAGRQGDAGSTQFFVSLEDDLMRIFGGDKVKNIMARLNVPEDEPIQSAMVSKAIGSAQERIEGHHFDMRKYVLDYDEIINKHRETIYRMRREIVNVSGEQELKDKVLDMVRSALISLVQAHTAENGELLHDEIAEQVRLIIPYDSKTFEDFKYAIKKRKTPEALSEYLIDNAEKAYQAKRKSVGEEGMRVIEKAVLLRPIDQLWMDHLDHMDYMRTSVGLRAYGQRDPLVEYKKEGKIAFEALLSTLENEVARLIFRVGIVRAPESAIAKNLQFRGASKHSEKTPSPQAIISARPKNKQGKKIGRNERVKITNGKETKELKYKKALPLLESGKWRLIGD